MNVQASQITGHSSVCSTRRSANNKENIKAQHYWFFAKATHKWPVIRNALPRHGVMKSHYSDVIMGTIGSQITSFMIVYSVVYLGVDQRKYQSSASLAFVFTWFKKKTLMTCEQGALSREAEWGAGNSPVTVEFHAQRASNAENVSISWRHRVLLQ